MTAARIVALIVTRDRALAQAAASHRMADHYAPMDRPLEAEHHRFNAWHMAGIADEKDREIERERAQP